MQSSLNSQILLAPLRWLTGSLFLETYQRSDGEFWQRHETHGCWRSLGNLLTCRSTLIGMQAGSETKLLFTLKAAHGWVFKIARLELAIKQKGKVHRHMLVVRNLDDREMTVSLQDIAFDAGLLEQQDSALMGQLLIKVLELKDSDGNDVLGRKKVTIFKPTLELYRGKEFKRLRGRYWNVELIRDEKQRLRQDWYRRLVKPAGQLWRPLTMRRLLYRVVANEWALSFLYWLQMLTASQPAEDPAGETVR